MFQIYILMIYLWNLCLDSVLGEIYVNIVSYEIMLKVLFAFNKSSSVTLLYGTIFNQN